MAVDGRGAAAVGPAAEARADSGTGRRHAPKPIGRESLNERVHAELRRSLIQGVFEAGEVPRIVDLAATPRTSTMPVREALARLVSEQALEALPSRSVRVSLITRARLGDIARARCLIEGELTARAVGRLGPAELAELAALTVACEATFAGEAPDRARATSELDHAHHFAIYRNAGSAVLIPIVESLWLRSGPHVRAAARIHDKGEAGLAVHHHWALIRALERRDIAAAKVALNDDITQSFDLIRASLDLPEGAGPHV